MDDLLIFGNPKDLTVNTDKGSGNEASPLYHTLHMVS